VPAEIIAECSSGSVKLDFTEASVPHREVIIRAKAASGSVVLIVPHDWVVVMDDVSSVSGSIVNKVGGRPSPYAQTLRVSGSVHSGAIKARYPRRSFWDWLRGRRHPAAR
jgi:predicted membrane protein